MDSNETSRSSKPNPAGAEAPKYMGFSYQAPINRIACGTQSPILSFKG